MDTLHLHINSKRFRVLIGTGGIGSGSFFRLNENHTLGREESRSGVFLDQKDYCKLHIITHYIKSFLEESIDLFPVGRIGDDSVGNQLLKEMRTVGMSTDYVRVEKGEDTLFSFCYLYPDGSGGNLTTSNSACSKTRPDDITKTKYLFSENVKKGIALAVPEVPLETRFELLQLATEYKFFRAASFTTEEMLSVLDSNILNKVDYLAINIDEAAALIGSVNKLKSSSEVVEKVVLYSKENYPGLYLSVTDGSNGSWAWDGHSLEYFNAFQPKKVFNTAGAGDAYFAGVLTGISTGSTFHEAQRIGALLAAYSVTSNHTIHHEVSRRTLIKFAQTQKISLRIQE
ncbi:carbohydrate kinase family protein [Rhodohalobacter sulfatireducens]|uniref:PfkB family carbohydrate kinase n=1 Tax=Rhodohalobacter sulfatireducens TaxID=2911366 RepID=A0ABS9K9E2_9BACT|nr:PfkB family carbohydrate kinase [Rhodohalobacter sulfatireducens]MCG2587464.1 PfkB family carbohydrate kinase [Rhodohalobacter sulfatireducens]